MKTTLSDAPPELAPDGGLPTTSCSPLRVFEMNDCDWYFARSLQDAKNQYQSDVGCDECDMEEARELTDAELDTLQYWDDEERDESNPRHWQCECGAMADGHCRWTGEVWQHHHGYPVGHVDMVNIHKRTFRQQLEKLIAAGTHPGMFATTEY